MADQDPQSERAYWYRHTNGSLHRKPAIVVDSGGGAHEYFNSPFVKRWWFGQASDEPDGIEKQESRND